VLFAEGSVAQSVLEEGTTVARGLVYGQDLAISFFPFPGKI
jgi:hypothetical protein